MKIEYLDIEKVKPYKNNPRINENSVNKVYESIKEFGFRVPIVVDKDYTIITGHTRYEAALMLFMDQIPAIVAKDLDEAKSKQFRLVDNKVQEYSEWDFEKLAEELEKVSDYLEGVDIFLSSDEANMDFDYDEVGGDELDGDLFEESENEFTQLKLNLTKEQLHTLLDFKEKVKIQGERFELEILRILEEDEEIEKQQF